MAKAAQRAATYQDLLAVPDYLVAEILFGSLVTHPRPGPRHSIAGSALGSPFQFGRGGRPGGWIFMDEPELHLGDHVVVPDLAGWHRERLPSMPDTSWIETAPDWICEVLSPSTERYDRGDKRIINADAGVRHLWHVDPGPRLLEVFELREGKWLLAGVFQDDAEAAAPPFAACPFRLGLLWPFDPPSPEGSGP
jgi:Uma2 family endonuclease